MQSSRMLSRILIHQEGTQDFEMGWLSCFILAVALAQISRKIQARYEVVFLVTIKISLVSKNY